MSYSDQYPDLLAKLCSVKGSFGVDAQGSKVPALFPSDMAGLLALYQPGLAHAIRRETDLVVNVAYCDENGVIMLAEAEGQSISAEAYLSGQANTDAAMPWQRRPIAAFDIIGGGTYYEPARIPHIVTSDETDLVKFTWQAVSDYQACLELGAQAFLLYGSTPVSKSVAGAFMKALKALGSDLDVLAENPPPSLADNVRGALKAAANASAKSAGELAGVVGNTAGDLAGNILEGFLNSANLVTLGIAGVIAYKVL